MANGNLLYGSGNSNGPCINLEGWDGEGDGTSLLCGLSVVMASRGYSLGRRGFSCFGAQAPGMQASIVVALGLSYGLMGLVAPQHMESPGTRN